jgi:hypothetical protein
MDIHDIRPPEVEAARRLLEANGWTGRVSNRDEFRELVSRSQRALVGIEAVMGNDQGMTWVLRAARHGVAEFWERIGFVPSQVAMERPRKKT